MSNTAVLKIENLTKIYDNTASQNMVLHNLNLEIDERDFLCILGPSGCGKTTLLRCIAGFEKYDGSIFVHGEKRQSPGIDRVMVFQDFNQLFPWQTVEENIQYPLKLKGIKDKLLLNEVSANALARVNLLEYEKYYPFQLSGGMKQRVAIAKALALKPQIVLMDEPFAALDAMTRRILQNELLRIAEEEVCTFIFITHNIQESLILGKRIIVFSQNGKVVLDQRNTITRPVTPASKGYVELWKRLNDALYA